LDGINLNIEKELFLKIFLFEFFFRTIFCLFFLLTKLWSIVFLQKKNVLILGPVKSFFGIYNPVMNITSRLIEIEEEDEVEVFHGPIFSMINTLTTEEGIIEEANGINSEANIVEQSYDQNTDDNNQTRTSNIEEAADYNEHNSEEHFTSNDAEENNAIVDDQA